MTTYAAIIKTIRFRDNRISFEVWGNWDDRQTATEVLENLIAAFSGRGMMIAEAMTLTDAEARALVNNFYSI